MSMCNNLVDFTESWKTVQSLDAAKKLILSSNQAFAPTHSLEKLPLQDSKVVLDFGCGVGRNIPALLAGAPNAHVVAYDFPNMQELARQYLGLEKSSRIDWRTPPPENLRAFTYDFVVADITFQHIRESELRLILSILGGQLSRNGKLWVSSRGWSDDNHKSVWEIVLDYFYPVTLLDLEAAVGDNHQQVLFRRRAIRKPF
jgi:cyclopropane fatty-acyl-phospholipid synthase-like methyltransferase